MAPRLFGRSRSHTATQISKPTLTFSDAAPRDDLQLLGQTESPRSRLVTTSRPRAASGRSPQQIIPNNVSAFDFTVTEPPDDPRLSEDFMDRATNDGMIGIALSSPGMAAPPHEEPIDWYRPKETPWIPHDPDASIRRKPSKWKKLGGLFKGKQDAVKPSHQSPFYQVQINDDPLQLSTERLMQPSTEWLMQPDYPQSRNVPYREMLETSVANGYAEAFPNLEDEGRGSQAPRAEGNFLAIDIPSVEMERYSVMFGSVLGSKQPPGLLARRNQAVDRLKVTEREHDLPGVHKPQRRATSPVPSKSPAFTLFPSATTFKASLSSNGAAVLPGTRSPCRANTFPAQVSHYQHGANLALTDLMTPATSASRSQGQWSAEPSPASYDERSADEETLLKRLPIKSYVNENEEPVWEMVAHRDDSPESMIRSANSTPATTPEEDSKNPLRPHPLRSDSLSKFSTARDRVEQIMTENPAPMNLRRAQTASPSGLITTRNQSAVTSTMLARNIEISVARSISLSQGRAPRKTLVPLGVDPEQFQNSHERFGEHQQLVPMVVDVSRGHRPNKSQNALIEKP